ncbi:MAG: hypothetical protein ABWK53_12065 [Anaerolineales bacterium]
MSVNPVESKDAKGSEAGVLTSLLVLAALLGCLALVLGLVLIPLVRSSLSAAPLLSPSSWLFTPLDGSQATGTLPLPRLSSTPSPTRISVPRVLVYNGERNAYFEIDKWRGRALLYVRYEGQGYFSLTCYDSANLHTLTSVNTEGPYEGVLPLDFFPDEHTTRISIQASGPWLLEIRPLEMMERVTVPGRLEGRTDRVVRLEGKPAVELTVSTSGYISIWGYGDSRTQPWPELLVNDYPRDSSSITITAEIPPGVTILSIHATEEWSVVISGRSP